MIGAQVTNYVVAANPTVLAAIQDRTLARVYEDAAFPNLMFRAEAEPEKWEANLGTNTTFTRTALMRPTTRPIVQNKEPTPKSFRVEQWEATAAQWGDTIDTHMLTSNVALESLHLRNVHQLGLHSGQSINRIVRDKVYNAYLAGHSVVSESAVAGVSLPVVSLNGFTRKLFNGRPAAVSSTNPLTITIVSGGVSSEHQVTGFVSDYEGDEIHGGVLTITPAHTGVVARDLVLASNRSELINSGGAVGIDGIGAADHLSVADIRAAIAKIRSANIPPHSDGKFHFHLGPISESQIYGDNEFQRLNQGMPDHAFYREFAIGSFLGTLFLRNTECPSLTTVDQDHETGFTFAGELVNVPLAGAPVEIHRPIITGQGYLEEKYIDESKFITEAGILGKIGEFAVTNAGISVMLERVRMILRSPIDRFQQQVSSSWTISGDWTLPTDSENPASTGDYCRAVVIQHAA